MSETENTQVNNQETVGRPKMPEVLIAATQQTVTSSTSPEPPAQEPQKSVPFYQKSWLIALMVLIFWPVGLVLMWSSGCTWKKNIKILVTVVVISLSALNLYSIYRAINDDMHAASQETYSYTEPLQSETAQNSVETTSDLLSTTDKSDKSTYVATPLLDSASQNELLSVFSDFEPQIIQGKGNQTIDMSAYSEPVLVTVDYDGEDLISVWTGESASAGSILLVNSIGKFHGTTTTLLASEAPTQLTVEESGDSTWTITISPLNRIPNAEAKKTYFQSQVLLVAPEDVDSMSKFSFEMTSNDATNSFEAYAIGKEKGSELALETGKSYSGEAAWSDLPCILMIVTDGEWNFTIS